MGGSAKVSKLAVSGLVLGIASFFVFILAPLAIVVGFAALYKINSSTGSLKGIPFAFAGLVIGFVALAFAGFMILHYDMHYRSFKVPTASMFPTIKSKERIVADLLAYKTKAPGRGDIVVYELLDKGKRRLMCKRTVGLPGEEIEIRSGKVYINGLTTDIPELPAGTTYSNAGDFGKAGQPVRIPEGFYYVLGDNPAASFDSRQHGPVDGRDIKGKYIFAYRGLPTWQIMKLLLKRTPL